MRQTSDRLRQLTPTKMRAHRLRVGMALLVAASSFVCGCARRQQSQEPKGPPPVTEATRPTESQPVRPKPNEVQEAVKRVFKEAALLDSDHNPNFIAGDFNGDNSPDIAVILKPAQGKLSEMNQDSPAWILRDPFVTAQPGTPSPRITDSEVLLAVIHGYGPDGWRDPQATQTYLLKHAVGSEVKTESKNEFVTANQGKKIPHLFGDLISEMLHGRSGCLYFADATYSWFDPKTFKGEPEKRLVHPGAEARIDKSDLLNLRAKRQVAVEK